MDGVPINDAKVEVWNVTGTSVRYDYVYAGTFLVGDLAPGTYFVVAFSYEGHVAELYDGLPCLDDCDPTKGTPVPVALAATTQVDFALDDSVTIFSDGFESGNVSAWSGAVGVP